jgi:hypothetical protein
MAAAGAAIYGLGSLCDEVGGQSSIPTRSRYPAQGPDRNARRKFVYFSALVCYEVAARKGIPTLS